LAPVLHAAAGAELRAVAARELSRAEALGPSGAVYSSYNQLIADPTVDAVYISLHNNAHAPWTVAALAAGKHVLCEKPLGLSAAEVDEMTAAAERAGCVLVEASMYRWHPRVRLTQQLLADGRIGAVRQVAAGFTFGGVAADNYRFDPVLGGGALYDVGCYAVSAALWAFGNASVQDVVAQCVMGPTGVDLVADLVVRFAEGEAEVHVGMDGLERQWLVITGDDGEIELTSPAYTAWLGSNVELLVSDGRGTERIPIADADAYRVMIEQVSAAINGDDAYVVPLAESRATAAVLDAAFASARGGGEPVPPN
jgi:predicted dehydrogenase